MIDTLPSLQQSFLDLALCFSLPHGQHTLQVPLSNSSTPADSTSSIQPLLQPVVLCCVLLLQLLLALSHPPCDAMPALLLSLPLVFPPLEQTSTLAHWNLGDRTMLDVMGI